MTNEDAIKWLENLKQDIGSLGHENLWPYAQAIDEIMELLEEKEAIESKTGHWIFESAYCDAWSHACSECGKRMTTAYNTYANYCWNCGTKMKDR